MFFNFSLYMLSSTMFGVEPKKKKKKTTADQLTNKDLQCLRRMSKELL